MATICRNNVSQGRVGEAFLIASRTVLFAAIAGCVGLRRGLAFQQHPLERIARARDAALDGADRHAGMRGDDFVGLALQHGEQQR